MGLLYWSLTAILPLGLGVLVLAYRRYGRGRRLTVSSNLLLKMLEQRNTARAKFKPPPRFFYEVLLVALLALAAAGLYRSEDGARVGILIDNSLSQGAVPAMGGGSAVYEDQSLFKNSQQQAQRTIDDLGRNARITLFVTSPWFQQIDDSGLSPSEAIGKVDELTTEFAPDNLNSALANLAALPDLDRLVVVSGRKLSEPIPPTRFTVLSAMTPALSNVAITEISLQRASDNQQRSELAVQISAFGTRATNGTIFIEELDAPSGKLVPITSRAFSIEAGRSINEQISIAVTSNMLIHARLEVSPQSRSNALAADDQAWLAVRPVRNQVLLVSDLTLAESGLERLATYQFIEWPVQRRGELFAPVSVGKSSIWDNELKSVRAALFHRVAPETSAQSLPPVSSLFILPPPSSIFASATHPTTIDLTRWQSNHALLSYMNMPLLQIPNATTLNAPRWLETIISTNYGPLLVAGEQSSTRYAAIGYEILPYEGGRYPLLAIFTLNALRWLTATAAHPWYQGTNEIIATDKVPSARYLDSTREVIAPGRNGELRAPRPGLIAVGSDPALQKTIAINFFDTQESDTSDQTAIALPQSIQSESNLKRERPTLTAWLALMVLGLIAIELLIMLARSRRVPA